jgi:hypothetical protein
MMKNQQKEKEISKEESFKAVYEYAAWGAIIHLCKVYIYGFFRFLSSLFSSIQIISITSTYKIITEDL